MSGRVRVTLADGRRVTGFRKTLRIQGERTPLHLLPDWRLSIALPSTDMRFFGFTPGPVKGFVGVTVHDLRVEVVGKRRSFVVGQAARLVRTMVPGFRGVIDAVLHRGDDPPLTTGAPAERHKPQVCQLRFDEGKAVLATARAAQVIRHG